MDPGPSSNVGSTAIVVLIGGFIGSATVVSATIVQLGVAHEYLGIATALLVTSRAVGGSVTTTLYSALLSNYVSTHLGPDVATALAHNGVAISQLPAVTEAIAEGSLTSPALVNISNTAIAAGLYASKVCFGEGFRLIYLVSITFGVLGLICAVFVNDVDHLMTNEVDIELREGAHIHAAADTDSGSVVSRDVK